MGAQLRRNGQAYSQLLFGRGSGGGASLREAASPGVPHYPFLLVIRSDRLGKLVGARGVATADNALKTGRYIVRLLTFHHAGKTLRVSAAAIGEGTMGDDTVLDLQFDLRGAGSVRLVYKHTMNSFQNPKHNR